jgi:hypothetical protein
MLNGIIRVKGNVLLFPAAKQAVDRVDGPVHGELPVTLRSSPQFFSTVLFPSEILAFSVVWWSSESLLPCLHGN